MNLSKYTNHLAVIITVVVALNVGAADKTGVSPFLGALSSGTGQGRADCGSYLQRAAQAIQGCRDCRGRGGSQSGQGNFDRTFQRTAGTQGSARQSFGQLPSKQSACH